VAAPAQDRVLTALAEVLRRLGGNTEPEGIADLLWLASQVRASEAAAAGIDPSGQPTTPGAASPAPVVATPGPQGAPTAVEPVVVAPTAGPTRSGAPAPEGPSVPLPGAGTFGEHLSLLRALRAFRTRAPGPPGDEIDEVATVKRVTEERLWEPVRLPRQEPAWAATVVIDGSTSMRMWRSRIGEVVRLLHNLGAFSGIQWRHLDATGALRAGAPPRMRLGLPATRVLPPRARPLTLVLTDGLDRRWADGRAGAALRTLARGNSLAVLHLLPFRLWSRTTLGRTVLPVMIKGGRARVDDDLLDDADEGRGDAFTAAPLVDLTPGALRAWSRLAQRGSGAWPAGVAVPAIPRLLAEAPAVDDATRLARFRNTASASARRLAALLALADRVELPLARAVRQACLPGAGFAEEVEVLLGGILQMSKANPDRPEAVELTMIPVAREALRWEVLRADLPGLFRELAKWLRARPEVPSDVLDVLMDPESAASIQLEPGDALVSGLLDAMRMAGGRWGEIAEDAAPAFGSEAEEAWLKVAAAWLADGDEEPAPLGRRAARAVRKRRNVELLVGTGNAATQLLMFRVMRADVAPDDVHPLLAWLTRIDERWNTSPSNTVPWRNPNIPARLIVEALGAADALAPGDARQLADHVTGWMAQPDTKQPDERALAQIRAWIAANAPARTAPAGGLLLEAFKTGATEGLAWVDVTVGDLVVTVASDAMKAAVGERTGVRLPVSYEETVAICKALDCVTPTQAICDAMFAHAVAPLDYVALVRTAADASNLATIDFVLRFGDAVDQQVAAAKAYPGALIFGAWKLWILHPRIVERGAVSYGFWDRSKKPPAPVQTPGAQHDAAHYDYAQLLQPVKRKARKVRTGEVVDLLDYIEEHEGVPRRYLDSYRTGSSGGSEPA
jgi:hypothetical protein